MDVDFTQVFHLSYHTGVFVRSEPAKIKLSLIYTLSNTALNPRTHTQRSSLLLVSDVSIYAED